MNIQNNLQTSLDNYKHMRSRIISNWLSPVLANVSCSILIHVII